MRSLFLTCLLVTTTVYGRDSLVVRHVYGAAEAGPARKVIATGMVGAILGGSLISSYYDWWKDADRPLHLTNDGLFNNYSLGIDKLGHAYTSYFYFHTFHNVMRWGGTTKARRGGGRQARPHSLRSPSRSVTG